MKVEPQTNLDVEAELHHVAIFGVVFLAFNTNLADIFGLVPGTNLEQFVPVNNFSLNEASLEVGVNTTSAFGSA